MKFFDKDWKGKNYKFYALRVENSVWIHFEGQTWLWTNQKKSEKTLHKASSKAQNLLVSQLPGRIQKIFVKKGDKVKRGQNLLILSAMKIEYSFKAEAEGQVEELFCSEGDTVTLGEKLIQLKYKDEEK